MLHMFRQTNRMDLLPAFLYRVYYFLFVFDIKSNSYELMNSLRFMSSDVREGINSSLSSNENLIRLVTVKHLCIEWWAPLLETMLHMFRQTNRIDLLPAFLYRVCYFGHVINLAT